MIKLSFSFSLKSIPCACLFTFCLGNGVKIQLKDFPLAEHSSAPRGRQIWAQREEIMPRCYIDTTQFRSAPNALAIAGNSNAAEHGGCVYRLPNIQQGKHYRFTAYYRTQWVQHEQLQVVARLDWRDLKDERAGQPDYAYGIEAAGDWKKITLQVPTPEKSAQAKWNWPSDGLPKERFGGTTSLLKRCQHRKTGSFALQCCPAPERYWT